MVIKNIALRCTILTILMLALPTIAAADDDDEYYLSLGTSLAAGIQPDAAGMNQRTDQGYPDQLFDILAAESDDLRLVNLGCPGETTTTMLAANY